MRSLLTARRATPLAPAVCIAVGLGAGLRAQPARPLIPVATNTVAAHPETYYGERVTITAAVQSVLSRTAFSIAQTTMGDASTAKIANQEILVLAPKLQTAVDPNAILTVLGEVVEFGPEEIAKKARGYTLDLSPGAIERYQGRPALIASAVIDEAFLDLTRRLPPPATPDEETLSKVMKTVAPAFAALRAGLAGSNVNLTMTNAAVLKQAFAETEAIWRTRGTTDALQWTAEARKNAEAIEAAATTGKWDAAKTASGPLGRSCGTCHTAHRERFDDGSYRIKRTTPSKPDPRASANF